MKDRFCRGKLLYHGAMGSAKNTRQSEQKSLSLLAHTGSGWIVVAGALGSKRAEHGTTRTEIRSNTNNRTEFGIPLSYAHHHGLRTVYSEASER
jgi:hypothetical protein